MQILTSNFNYIASYLWKIIVIDTPFLVIHKLEVSLSPPTHWTFFLIWCYSGEYQQQLDYK